MGIEKMNYVSLYRKWRSNNFAELVGQPVIVQTLKNAILNNRLAHAYLFSGPRGTGKTSTARILAKSLNCQQGPTINPCGECANCQKIKGGHAVDVIEIDAASNRGIDEIRELRERVRYAPLEGRYKVYIIDEVHMLTPEAFNALLKTLEEPPAQTIFVLATTELQKVPMTIISRCQRLDFSRIPLVEIKGQLKKIAQDEKITVDDKALDLIGRSAEGGMRDAISLFDQLISFCGQKIGYDDVVNLLGTADEELLFKFGEAIASRDLKLAIDLVRRAIEDGKAMLQVTRDLVGYYRNLLHLKVGSGELLDLTIEQQQRLKEQAQKYSLARIKMILQSLSQAELDMKWHPHGRLVLEISLVEIVDDGQPVATPQPVEQPKTKTEVTDLGPLVKIKDHWKTILDGMKRKSVFGYVSLREGEPMEVTSDGKLVIGFRKGYSFHKERLEEAKNKQALEEAIREVTGSPVAIQCIINENGQKSGISVKSVADFFDGRIV
ncbi:hypothetical protein A2311_04385 [candidate division WOR-1 bacterium RIFOXYB2_FULL_48_7]|uniref:DNA polymerase III subunit gamma/tau n=1 Tax=candidate division WOR-1 bacterium RIFOXYB2_FULL_48_7 TaxID=1802583 RepID=A0A1F4TIX9_UNCSA|nr:MAG: hypothetical protein A2311_04385 [candidate division WOR-1 bacterium RIFOXYB2_FULL_48_7]